MATARIRKGEPRRTAAGAASSGGVAAVQLGRDCLFSCKWVLGDKDVCRAYAEMAGPRLILHGLLDRGEVTRVRRDGK